MGNIQEQKYDLPKYDWDWAGNHNGLDLFKRRTDSLLAEKRRIVLDHRFTLEQDKQIYKLREANNLGFVRVYQVDGVEESKQQEKSSICKCAQSTTLNVYSQRIEHRLSDLPQLTFPESLRMLWETTNSFQQIYQKFGPFHINAELIGLTADNKIKVWVNQNFAMNHPSHEIPYLRTMPNSEMPPELRNENQMIDNLLQVVEEKTERGQYPHAFGEGVYQNSRSFHELKKYLGNYINNKFKDFVPDVIKGSTVMASQHQISNYRYGGSPNGKENVPTHHAEQGGTNQVTTTGPMKTSFIQSTYYPFQAGQGTGTDTRFGDKIYSSVGYQDSRTASKPASITFGSTVRPVEGNSFQINATSAYNPLALSYRSNIAPLYQFNAAASYQANATPSYALNSSNFENGQSHHPNFKLMYEAEKSQNNTSYRSTYEKSNYVSPVPSSQPSDGPNLQLQKIRNMLKQDINELSSHRSTYKIESERRTQ